MKKIFFLLIPLLVILIIGESFLLWRQKYFATSTKPTGKTYQVVETKDGFSPRELTIQAGDSVTFSTTTGQFFWPASNPHPTHTDYPEFDPKKPINAKNTWTFTFQKVGQWSYHDHLAPINTGKITVQGKQSQTSNSPLLIENDPEYAHWIARITEVGADRAYAEFKQKYATSTYETQHTQAHTFGIALYKKMGIAGVGNCDDSFGFGCYHTFFSSAIEENGMGILPQLDQECIKKWGEGGLGCQHGIGHGLMAYLGSSRLAEALDACATLNWQGPIGGCTSGVFMEYNSPTMVRADQLGLRPMDDKDPFAPCSTVADKFVQACYFEQPTWWLQTYQFDYTHAIKLCSQVTQSDARKACFRGLGNAIGGFTAFNVKKSLAICLTITNADDRILCQEGTSWSFFTTPKTREQADQLCANIDYRARRMCIEEAQIIKVTK